MTAGSRITAAADVAPDGSFRFTANRDGEDREVVLVRDTDGAVVAWENYCQHWTDVTLDDGDGAQIRGDDIVCGTHGATFGRGDGYCDFGPCEGAYLTSVDVAVRDGDVHLVDENYEFVDVGGVESDPTDLSTSPGERLGF